MEPALAAGLAEAWLKTGLGWVPACSPQRMGRVFLGPRTCQVHLPLRKGSPWLLGAHASDVLSPATRR